MVYANAVALVASQYTNRTAVLAEEETDMPAIDISGLTTEYDHVSFRRVVCDVLAPSHFVPGLRPFAIRTAQSCLFDAIVHK